MAANLLNLAQLVQTSGGQLAGSEPKLGLSFPKVVYDSRQVEPGSLFVALPGENSDGHCYIAEAVRRGASALLVSRKWLAEQSEIPPVPCVVVEDTLAAFQAVVGRWRAQLPRLNLIGITGSVGKTSTKELTAAVLRQRYQTFKSPKSFNNEYSLMPVLLELQPEHEQAVIEMGCGWGLGELTRLCRVAQPQIGVILNISHSHLSRMGSLENIARAKAELIQSLPPEGWAVLNGDDQRVRELASTTQAQLFFFGTDPGCDLWADEITSFGLDGLAFTLNYRGESRRFRLPLPGKHNVYTALAACAVGLLCGLSWEALEARLQDPTAHIRIVTQPGPNGSTIIDDCYNASAVSTLAALDLLAETPARRRVALLGDMLELGDYSEEAHRLVGQRAAQIVDLVVVYGELARIIGQEAQQSGLSDNQVHVAASKAEAAKYLQQYLQSGDLLLVKASRGVALEEVIGLLLKNRNSWFKAVTKF